VILSILKNGYSILFLTKYIMSCLFQSIAYLLGQGYNAKRVRHDICQAMLIHDSEIVIADTSLSEWLKMIGNPKEYIQRMRLSSTWGGGPELAIASYIYRKKIVVFFKNRPISVFCCHPKPNGSFKLNYTGSHYTPRV
jgi:hypothetical protein